MKIFKYITVGLIPLLILPLTVHAQKGRLKHANKLYNQKAYYYAEESYLDCLERGIDSLTISSKLASCYDHLKKGKKAAYWYNYIQNTGTLTQEELFRFAMVVRQLKKYDKSVDLLKEYKEKYGENDIVNNILESKTTIDELNINNDVYSVSREPVNSKYSDIGVGSLTDSLLFFVSSRRGSKAVNRISSGSGSHYYKFYGVVLLKSGKLGGIRKLKVKGGNGYNTGPGVYSKKIGYMYFSRTNPNQKGGDEVAHLQICRGKLKDGKIQEVEVLKWINGENYSSMHPTLSKDGDRLYFSSNRQGGMGGMDIYYVTLDANGKPNAEPVNLGEEINTSGNEVFPHYNSRSNLLFFSSNGRFGLGGLDVYVAKLNDDGVKVKSINNLGVPINSPYDDFSYMSDENQTKGYFSSNRPRGEGSDDIYRFDQHKKVVE